MVAVRGSPCFVSSCRISHLGMKPVKGGRPPKERRERGTRAVRTGALAQEVARVFMLVALLSLKVRNVAEVIAMYRRRERRVREGANWRIRIIHPRCAIEE